MTDPIRIALLGADGRMGLALIAQIFENPQAHLVAGVSAPGSANLGKDLGEMAGLSAFGVALTSDLRAALNICDVLIDFSAPKSAIDAALMMSGVSCKAMVSGTTGFTQSEETAFNLAGDDVCLVQSGNFSMGVNVLTALVARAAKALNGDWDAEVLEMHHRHKIDAPSGTALMLGRAIADGRDVDFDDKAVLSREGQTGARRDGDIGFAALRGGSVVGDHEVILASELEMITLSHRALDRSVFARGALTAALWAAGHAKGKYDMGDVLGLKD
ncbi:MAG: 4-hydroxy-tetrahydrodipicolinate reductase [Robiginitomaculum sp.]